MSSNNIKSDQPKKTSSVEKKYIVTRNGVRVSESDYNSKEEAKIEYDHWKRIVEKWPDGSKIEIVESKN